MRYVTSQDGTKIAFTQSGQGPALIVVVGAFNDRFTGMPLTNLLQEHFTVVNYDRRGRGDSSDTAPYAVDREIEDLEALIAEVGGSAAVFGYSSGAILSLKAAACGLVITGLALYEPPLIAPDTAHDENTQSSAQISNASGQVIEIRHQRRTQEDITPQLAKLIAEDRRGEAVELFQTKLIGIPSDVVAQLRQAPFWPSLEKIAHTLVYEATIVGTMSFPMPLIPSITIPTLVMAGGDSPAFLQDTARWLGNILPKGQHRILENQTHDIVPAAVAPVVETFLANIPTSS